MRSSTTSSPCKGRSRYGPSSIFRKKESAWKLFIWWKHNALIKWYRCWFIPYLKENGFLCILQFLSMKLAAVNPQLGLNIEGILSKDVCSRLTWEFLIPFQFEFARNLHQNYEMHSLLISNWNAAYSLPWCSSICSPRILIVAVRHGPGRRSWIGQFEWIQNSHAGAIKWEILVQRACFWGLQRTTQYFFFVISLKLERPYFHIP